MRSPVCTLALLPLLLLAAGHVDPLDVTSRNLKGLIFDGAPGTYFGDNSEPHVTTTHAYLVGHLGHNGTFVLDDEAIKEIADMLPPPPEAMVPEGPPEAYTEVPTEENQAPETFAIGESPEVMPPADPSSLSSEGPHSEEDLLAIFLGFFFGSFTAVAVFMGMLYCLLRKRWMLAPKEISLPSSSESTDRDSNRSFCTIEYGVDDPDDDDGNPKHVIEFSPRSLSVSQRCRLGDDEEADCLGISEWSAEPLPRRARQGGKTFVLV